VVKEMLEEVSLEILEAVEVAEQAQLVLARQQDKREKVGVAE
jgi:hypothetical protein